MRAYLYMTSKKTFSFSCSTLLIFLMRSKHHARLLTSNIYEYFLLLLWDENVLEGNVIGWWDWMRCSLTWWLSYEDIQNWMLYAERKNIIIFSPSFVDENVKALGKILNIDQKKFFYSYIVVFLEWKFEEGMNLFMTLRGNKSKLEMCVSFNCALDFLSCWCDIWMVLTQSVGTLN